MTTLDDHELITAALALVRAYDANVDAINGLGHLGEPHDKLLHTGPLRPGGVEIFDAVGDCAACGGAQYGTEDAVQEAVVAVKLALGEPLRGYEQHRLGGLHLSAPTPVSCRCGAFVPDSSGDAGCGNCGADYPPAAVDQAALP